VAIIFSFFKHPLLRTLYNLNVTVVQEVSCYVYISEIRTKTLVHGLNKGYNIQWQKDCIYFPPLDINSVSSGCADQFI